MHAYIHTHNATDTVGFGTRLSGGIIVGRARTSAGQCNKDNKNVQTGTRCKRARVQ